MPKDPNIIEGTMGTIEVLRRPYATDGKVYIRQDRDLIVMTYSELDELIEVLARTAADADNEVKNA